MVYPTPAAYFFAHIFILCNMTVEGVFRDDRRSLDLSVFYSFLSVDLVKQSALHSSFFTGRMLIDALSYIIGQIAPSKMTAETP